MSIGILLYLDLEFWEGTLKTLTPSLQENAKYFTTRSYLTLTIYQIIKGDFGGFIQQISGGLYEYFNLKHYVVISENYIVEIITEWEPDIQVS